MLIREKQERQEHEILSPYASFSDQSRGRDKEEEQCDLRTVYQRDRDRIIHCKAFRRLKHKTQVFLSPGDDHYRTRLTHTLEVAQIARTIARSKQSHLVMIWGIHHLDMQENGHCPDVPAGRFSIMNRVCVWWKNWRKGEQG